MDGTPYRDDGTCGAVVLKPSYGCSQTVLESKECQALNS